MRDLFAAVLILLLGLVQPLPVLAQDTPPDETPNGPEYTVQAGDSLYAIGVAFGVTIEAIQQANGLGESDGIIVGQTLLIPGFEDVDGQLATQEVVMGDSLTSLAYRLGNDIDSLVTLNRIVNPTQLYVGQQLIHLQAEPLLSEGRLYRTTTSEALNQVAVRANLPPGALAQLNGLAHPALLFGGQQLVLPEPGTPLTGLATPMLGLTLSPDRARHGYPLVIRVEVEPGTEMTGQFNTWPLTFFPDGNTSLVALQGVYAFTEPGLYPLSLTATAPDGRSARFSQSIPIGDAGFEFQQIVLTGDTAALLDPNLVGPERDLIASVTAPVTTERYWSGVWQQPVNMDYVTAPFGIRRSYNGGPYDSFHSGIDLGGNTATPVVAPAGGVVVLAEPLVVRGNAIVIDHGWGVYTGYWHLSQMLVTPGQAVVAGQQIGYVGSTGLSTGNHLHYEVWVGGNQVDPPTWMQYAIP